MIITSGTGTEIGGQTGDVLARKFQKQHSSPQAGVLKQSSSLSVVHLSHTRFLASITKMPFYYLFSMP
jgi:hypothetical protein